MNHAICSVFKMSFTCHQRLFTYIQMLLPKHLHLNPSLLEDSIIARLMRLLLKRFACHCIAQRMVDDSTHSYCMPNAQRSQSVGDVSFHRPFSSQTGL